MFASKVELKVVGATEPNQYFRHSIDVLKAKWYQFHEIDSDEDNDHDKLEEIDVPRKGSYKVYCKGQYRYYLYERWSQLLPFKTDIYETKESERDDNNYEMPAPQNVITCSYLDIVKI